MIVVERVEISAKNKIERSEEPFFRSFFVSYSLHDEWGVDDFIRRACRSLAPGGWFFGGGGGGYRDGDPGRAPKKPFVFPKMPWAEVNFG
jgi:hypothetical protein